MKLKLTLVLSFTAILGAFGQNVDKAIKKANKYYQLGQYTSAIPYYQQAVSEKKNAGLFYKLGNCYRLTNKTEEAENVYQTLFELDKRIRDKAYLHYSEVLMSNGKYETAKEYLSSYVELKPEDESAKKTLANIDEIRKIKSHYTNVELTPFSSNSEADEHGAVFIDNGIIFVSDRKRGATLFKEQNGTTGRDFLSLYFAPRTGRLEYGEPQILPRKINSLNKNTGPASFTSDGKIMYYSQNDHSENNKGEFSLQLYSCKRENGKWKDIKKLNFCNSSINYMHPAVSPDGEMLFFISDRNKGEGGADLYMAKLRPDGSWNRPENMGPIVNTTHHEGFPFYGSNDKLYFCSKGHLGYGGFDIFFTEMDEFGNWSAPTNVGQPINSSQDDISFAINGSDKYGLFTSSRDGGDDDIFMFRFQENDVVVSLSLVDSTQENGITDASVQAIPLNDTTKIKEINMAADKTEMTLDKDQSYEIIISKEGYIPFSKIINSTDEAVNFLELEAVLLKKI